jgi:hypothetical protein
MRLRPRGQYIRDEILRGLQRISTAAANLLAIYATVDLQAVPAEDRRVYLGLEAAIAAVRDAAAEAEAAAAAVAACGDARTRWRQL